MDEDCEIAGGIVCHYLHTFIKYTLLRGVEGDGDGGRCPGRYGALWGGDGYATAGVFGAGDDKGCITLIGGGEGVRLLVAPLGERAEVVREVVEHQLWLGRIVPLLLPAHWEGSKEEQGNQ